MAPLPSHTQSLLPNPDILFLDRIERYGDRFRLSVHVEQDPLCPLCGEVSRSGIVAIAVASRICRGKACLFSCGRRSAGFAVGTLRARAGSSVSGYPAWPASTGVRRIGPRKSYE